MAVQQPLDTIIRYITGVDANGTLTSENFASWNGDQPATYGPESEAAKWGAPTAGTGATISFSFDASAQWTGAERSAFESVFDLWSTVANIHFVQSSENAAQLHLRRSTDGTTSAAIDSLTPGTIGSSTLGTARSAHISIASGVAIGEPLSVDAGAAWTLLVHEVGHVLGLGNAGPYGDFDLGDGFAMRGGDTYYYTVMSNRHMQIMTYPGQPYVSIIYQDFGGDDDLFHLPTTWQQADILAIQRLYGAPVNSQLVAGGTTFGFNTNITGPMAKFFDFSLNVQPVVTLWGAGSGNKLDLSGFTDPSNIDLSGERRGSVAGLRSNITLAEGLRIDTVIGGSGGDVFAGDNDGNLIIGGAGADFLSGGASNDHLYGGGTTVVPGDGGDTLVGGGGGDYLQGNAGNDELYGDTNNITAVNFQGGSDRLYGGQGNDSIIGGRGNDTANGNLGNDRILGEDGNDALRGGQGNDSIVGGDGDDILSGDRGADTVTGGAGMDQFNFAAGDAVFEMTGPSAYQLERIDFAAVSDHIHLSFGVPTTMRAVGSYENVASAEVAARQALTNDPTRTDVAWAIIGSGQPLITLFYEGSPGAIEAFQFTASSVELSYFL